VFVSRSGPRYTEAEAREAIENSRCWAEALRFLGARPAGGHHATLRKWAVNWGISTAHFDAQAVRSERGRAKACRLQDVLVEGSSYPRGHLKRRLFESGLKERTCELCGQGEDWHGRHMALILDHINGTSDDNRLENLRIVCPNCAATLETHCGRNMAREPRECPTCGSSFEPRFRGHRYCSRACHAGTTRGVPRAPRPEQRKVVERPPYEQLIAELAASSYVAVGRK